MADEMTGVLKGISVKENGSISLADAAKIRKRLRVRITGDEQALYVAIEDVLRLCNKIMNNATIEFAVEDLTDPNKEF